MFKFPLLSTPVKIGGFVLSTAAVAVVVAPSKTIATDNKDNTIKGHINSQRLFLADLHQTSRNSFKSVISTFDSIKSVFVGIEEDLGLVKKKPSNPLDLGPLKEIVGTWTGNEGYMVIAVPQIGSKPSGVGDFKLIQTSYREELCIKPLGAPVKQRGGNINQDNIVCTYEKTVFDTNKFPNQPDKQTIIHVENGMFYYLDNLTTQPGNKPVVGTKHKPPYAIARSACVPHGDAAMLFGSHPITSDGPPDIPHIAVEPFTVPAQTFAPGYLNQYITQPGANNQPTDKLRKALSSGPNVNSTVHFQFDTTNDGGVLNTHFIKDRANAKEFKADWWVETGVNKEGKEVKQLQYAEVAKLSFHHVEGGDPKILIQWPHVFVNTLTKVDEDEEY